MTNEEIEAKIADLECQIAPRVNERDKLKQMLLERKSQFKVGDEITWQGGRNRGRVLSIIPWCGNEVYWKVRRIRKDGSEGCVTNVYPWNLK